MTTEERLTRALHEEAEQVNVDLAGLHAATRSRIGTQRPSRGLRSSAPVLVAALVLAVLAGAAVLRLSGVGLDRVLPADEPGQGPVDSAFTCPAQITADEAARTVDDALVPDLDRGPAEAARQLGAPRYAYREEGDRAVLRLGNADGTLAATATFRRGGADGWVLDTTRRCAGRDNGISVPGTDHLRLGRRDVAPYPAKAFGLDPGTAVFVDDRPTYDQSGLARHRSVWTDVCSRRACVVGGVPDSHVVAEVRPNVAPENISGVLLDPDAMVGRRAAFALWAVYDADGTVASVTAERRDGSTRPAEVIQGRGWTGRLLLLLDDAEDVRRVTVRNSDGTTVDYRPEQLTE